MPPAPPPSAPAYRPPAAPSASAFDDRSVSLEGALDQVAQLGAVLGSKTRLAVLQALMRSGTPLHINELARRVGVDASPVRTHLELLVKAGLAIEVPSAIGRERYFATRLSDVRLTLKGVNRPAAPPKPSGPPPKDIAKLEKKLAGLAKDMASLEEKARRVQADIEAAWARATRING